MPSTESFPQREAVIVRRLADELPNLVPNIDWKYRRKAARDSIDRGIDLIAEARIGNLTQTILFEVKSIGEPRMVERAITQFRRLAQNRPDAYFVFVAPYISERSRELCKSEGLGYLDLVGNTYLRFGSVLVDRVGLEGRSIEKRSLRSLFAPKATRVLRALLLAPKEPATITKLAETCSMSPAGVYLVVDLLETKGFVTRAEDRSISLEDPDRLLREWAKNWSWERSRRNYYFSFDKTADQIIKKVSETTSTLGLEYALTGMAGASFVAPFVRYAEVSFYLKGDREELVKAMDLRPVSSGANVVILDPYDEGVFAGAREIRGCRVVSDIQLFVDLYSNPARGEEQAEALFEKAIKFQRAK